jgi:hypothetical protein
MRPLQHLGSTADYDLFELNETLYDSLLDRGDKLLEDAYKEHMGHYYNNEPIGTLEELKEECESLLKQKSRMVELGAPESLIEHKDQRIVEIYNKIQNKKYGKLSDPVYKKYRESYYNRSREWNDSPVRSKLLNEICAYNEAEYNKIKTKEVNNAQ